MSAKIVICDMAEFVSPAGLPDIAEGLNPGNAKKLLKKHPILKQN